MHIGKFSAIHRHVASKRVVGFADAPQTTPKTGEVGIWGKHTFASAGVSLSVLGSCRAAVWSMFVLLKKPSRKWLGQSNSHVHRRSTKASACKSTQSHPPSDETRGLVP